MRSVLFLFLDGLGLGDEDAERNPLVAARTPVMDELSGGSWSRERAPVARPGRVFRALDATLGFPGLPQSATGQTTLLTGCNAARAMGGHYGPWPGPTLRRLLSADGLFHRGLARGGARLANAYPPGFFAALEGRGMRLNAPAHAARAAGLTLPDLGAYREGSAFAVDLDGAYFARLDPQLRLREPRAEGAALAAGAASRAFTFFDLWWTDRAGHARDRSEAVAYLERFDAFLGGAIDTLPSGATLVVTSDHGNVEEIEHGRHTRNRVPLLALGAGAVALAHAHALTDVAPGITAWWDAAPTDPR